MTKYSRRYKRFIITVLSLVFLSSLVVIEYYFFQKFLGYNTYFKFWIDQGPLGKQQMNRFFFRLEIDQLR